MMLLIIIAWILSIANAPWWIWMCFIIHIVGSFVVWIFNGDANKLVNKLKE